MPTDIDWARLAAFIDGEGSIRVAGASKENSRSKLLWPTFSLTIEVNNTDLCLMDWLQRTFGGTVKPKTRSTPRKRALFQWYVPAGMKRDVLMGCMPYFILKRRQAELGLAFMRLLDRSRAPRSREKFETQESVARELNSLNLTRDFVGIQKVIQ